MPFTNDGPPLWVNADKSKVVPAGSPDAAFLLVGSGGVLDDEAAAKYGLKAKAEPPANKAKAEAPTNKSGLTIEKKGG